MDNDFATGYAIGQSDGNGGGGHSGGMFGGDGSWIFAFLIIALIFGGNWGLGGNGGGQNGAETRTAINEGFALNGIERGISGIQQGLCDGFYAMNTGMLNGFNGVQSQLCSMAAQNQACCCETQRLVERGFADTNYNLATQSCETRTAMQSATRDIIDAQNAGTRAVLDFLTQDRISSLQAENQALKLSASQANQNAYLTAAMDANTAELVRRINPAPVPSYTVPAPYPYCGQTVACGGCC